MKIRETTDCTDVGSITLNLEYSVLNISVFGYMSLRTFLFYHLFDAVGLPIVVINRTHLMFKGALSDLFISYLSAIY